MEQLCVHALLVHPYAVWRRLGRRAPIELTPGTFMPMSFKFSFCSSSRNDTLSWPIQTADANVLRFHHTIHLQ
jgi:hypothetical protein